MRVERVAVIGDIHGCYLELAELYSALSWNSLDEIWTVGDIVDRGPSSHEAVRFCRERGIKSVLGNHEQSILNHSETFRKTGVLPKNKDKARTVAELDEQDISYILSLPPLHVIDELGLIIVHGGVWPGLPLYAQPLNVCRAQLIHPDLPRKTVWWGEDAAQGPGGASEAELIKQGWRRWYELYDFEEDCIYGHSSFAQPAIHRAGRDVGKTIGVDTGSCFGGSLTAAVYDRSRRFHFVSIKSKRVWYADTRRSFWEL